MTCARYADLDFVERYVLGQMTEAEQAIFEAHYFECPDCFTAPASRVVDFSTHPARGKNGDAGAPGKSAGPRLLASAGTWIGLAVAASLAAVMIWSPWRSRGPEPPASQPGQVIAQQTPPKQPEPAPSQPAVSPQPAPSQSGTSSGTSQVSGTGASAPVKPTQTTPAQTPTRPAVTLDALALVVPPPFVALQTRGEDAGANAAFSAAMKKYAAKDYRGAIDSLKPIVAAQPDAAHAAFFLGVSYLAAGEPAEASAVLNRVAAGNVAPYADEAHFYLAKAALRAHDLDRAEHELSIAIERQAGPPNEAARLQQALRLYRHEHGQ
jgi:TolA-binding protein